MGNFKDKDNKIPTRKVKQPKKTIHLANTPKYDTFSKLIENETGRRVVKELKFHPMRRWRFDYAIPDVKVAIEIDGGLFGKGHLGRHSGGMGQKNDMEKMNAAAVLGWAVLHFTPDQRFSEYCFSTIKETVRINSGNNTGI